MKDFFSKHMIVNMIKSAEQICRKLRIWSHSLKKSYMENFIFCAVFRSSRAEVFFKKTFKIFGKHQRGHLRWIPF